MYVHDCGDAGPRRRFGVSMLRVRCVHSDSESCASAMLIRCVCVCGICIVVDKAKSAKEATASFFTKVGANIKERSNSLFKKDATPTPDAANTTAPTPDAANTTAPTPAADVNPSAEGMNAAPVSTPAQQEEQPVPVPMGSEATT